MSASARPQMKRIVSYFPALVCFLGVVLSSFWFFVEWEWSWFCSAMGWLCAAVVSCLAEGFLREADRAYHLAEAWRARAWRPLKVVDHREREPEPATESEEERSFSA